MTTVSYAATCEFILSKIKILKLHNIFYCFQKIIKYTVFDIIKTDYFDIRYTRVRYKASEVLILLQSLMTSILLFCFTFLRIFSSLQHYC